MSALKTFAMVAAGLMVHLSPLVAQTAGADGRSPRRVDISLAAGTDGENYYGVGMTAHAMLAVSYARSGLPVEFRGDFLARSRPSGAGSVALSTSAVVPLARIGMLGAQLRPYMLAGVGAAEFSARVPSIVTSFGYHYGGGARVESERMGIFSELRVHSQFRRSFLSLGASWRL